MIRRVALTIIARNEEQTLPRCLASAADLVDEIVVVDTGSTDRTREIAATAQDRHGMPSRVIAFEWCDDFSAARNETLRHATAQWIFWMDADDWLDETDRQRLAELFLSLGDENVVYQMVHTSPAAADGGHPASAAFQDRLFRNLPGIRWQGRVHEQIVPAVLRSGGRVERTTIAIQHSGYEDEQVRRQKVERNLRLLLLENGERPQNAHTLFCLGMTYGMAGRPAEAIPCLQQSMRLLAPRSSLLPRLYLLLADCWRLVGETAQAYAVCAEGAARFPADSDLAQLLAELTATRRALDA